MEATASMALWSLRCNVDLQVGGFAARSGFGVTHFRHPLARGCSPVSLQEATDFVILCSLPRYQMQHVTGIGGFFFRAKDPTAVARWYKEHLGVDLVPADYNQRPWSQEAGPTVFAPFPIDTDYFGDQSKSWMINFRVRNLEAMVQQLRGSGIEVTVDSEIYPNGRFGRLYDPEGNPIELWEST